MATGTTSSASSISNLTGYCVVANARYGSNDDPGGTPECDVGGASDSLTSGRKLWDSDPSDGFDSGEVDVSFTAEAGGGGPNGLKWSVAGASPGILVYSGRTYGAIQKVQIRAMVQTTAKMQWSNVLVCRS